MLLCGNRGSQDRSRASRGGRSGPHHYQLGGSGPTPRLLPLPRKQRPRKPPGAARPPPYGGGWRASDRRRRGPNHCDTYETDAILGPTKDVKSHRHTSKGHTALRVCLKTLHVLKENADDSANVA